MKFKVGDVVQLKSGGPKMTVCLADGEYINTMWFDVHNQLNRSSFEPDSLWSSAGAL